MRICSYCGTDNPDNAVTCTSCGAHEFKHKCNNCGNIYTDEIICPKCGIKAGQKSRICPKCGREYYSSACPTCGYIKGSNKTDTSTFSVGNSTISQPPKTLKKRKTWLWVLGWLFIFPIPLTILLIRKKNMNKIVKYAIILIVWLIYLAIGSSSDSSTNTTESNNDTTRTSISQNSGEASENNNIKKLRFVNNRDVTVKVGDTETAGYLDVSVKSKKDFSPEDIIFISENPAVATISYTYDALTTCLYFEITGVGAGETQVYATSRDGMIVSDFIKVIVPQPILIESLELHTEKNEIVLGEKLVPSVSISPSNAEDRVLDWVSSDEAVATVDIDGTVIAVGDGSAIISATSRNGITSSFTVTVDGTKHLMNLRVTRSREDDVNIGDDWSFLNEVNGEYAYSSIGIGIGESLTLHTKITESDDNPDVGENTKWYTVTESDIANGFIVTMDVFVTENGGRNSGQSAHYIVTYTFSPIE